MSSDWEKHEQGVVETHDDMLYGFEKDIFYNALDKAVTLSFSEKETDPNGVDQHAPGAKLDKEKPDCSLLGYFGRALLEVARVGTFGAKKYTRGGWQYVDDGINRYAAAMLRHYFKEERGEIDDDSGLLHAAHEAWCALARLELILRDRESKEEGAEL